MATHAAVGVVSARFPQGSFATLSLRACKAHTVGRCASSHRRKDRSRARGEVTNTTVNLADSSELANVCAFERGVWGWGGGV